MMRQFGILLILIVVYSSSFLWIDNRYQDKTTQLHSALPATFQRAVSGYLRQLASEVLFVKTSVFLGGVKPGTPPATYSAPLANNFKVMTELYPQFVDPYFFCQSFLAPISPADAEAANSVLRTGVEHLPSNHILRFFLGFNYFQYLNDPLQSATVFKEAAAQPGAPPMFGRLAAIFSARGGNVQAGLIMLKAMLATEQDERIRERYQQEIAAFEKALTVEKAIRAYATDHAAAPETLQALIPTYLDKIPEVGGGFVLQYDPPDVKLVRTPPGTEKKKSLLLPSLYSIPSFSTR